MEREIWRPHLLVRLVGLLAGAGTAILAGSTIISPADGLSMGWRIAGPAFASALSLVFFRSATSLRVELQDDGVHVVNPFTRRYAGWTDIRAAHATDTGVVVTRTDGTVIVAWALKQAPIARWLNLDSRAVQLASRIQIRAEAAHQSP